LLSKDEEERLVNELDGQRTLIAYYRLPNGIAAVVATGIVQGSDEDFVVPASHHQKRSLLISASDPDNSGRPVRFFIGNNPNDGDCKQIWEFGGYYIDGPLPDGIATFRRTAVLATQDTRRSSCYANDRQRIR
jgi:hypothetical protein